MDPVTAKLMSAAGAAADPVYVDDVFSTFLYDGNGSAQTITNGIDLSGEGGMVIIKNRPRSIDGFFTFDTERGVDKYIRTNLANAEQTSTSIVTAFSSTGFSVGTSGSSNRSGDGYAAWTFRKCPGFFDVVTYTGNGSASGQTISHNLGSAPGSIWIKRTSAAEDWCVYHRSVGTAGHVRLNKTTNYTTNQKFANVTSTSFDIVDADVMINGNGDSYVAYIFAHDDQSFGDGGNEAIIKCGSFNSTGGVVDINLGFEPQWLLIKRSDASNSWIIVDEMRGNPVGSAAAYLEPNGSGAESTITGWTVPTPTGFTNNYPISGGTFIYIAIRRPHKPPEDATECFDVFEQTGSSSTQLRPGTSGSGVTDMAIIKNVDNNFDWVLGARLLGQKNLIPNSTASESTSKFGTSVNVWDQMSGTELQSGVAGTNLTSNNYVNYHFTRKPGFFDVVAYTGNGVQGRNISHNLGVAPDLMIVKNRDTTNDDWHTYVSGITHLSVYGSDPDSYGSNAVRLYLNETDAAQFSASGSWDHAHPTATTFRVGDTGGTNGNGENLIAYLFASLDGISKVGSYTGTGSDLNIDCGFTNGARFVLIKRTSGATDWWVLDTARGINAGNDPAHYLNGDAAETSVYDLVDPYSAGFTAVADTAAINSSGETYIFLAIA